MLNKSIVVCTVPHTGTHFAMYFLEECGLAKNKNYYGYEQQHCYGNHKETWKRVIERSQGVLLTVRDPRNALITVLSRHTNPVWIEKWWSSWKELHWIYHEYKEKLALINIECPPEDRVRHLEIAKERLDIYGDITDYAQRWKKRGSRPHNKMVNLKPYSDKLNEAFDYANNIVMDYNSLTTKA